MSHDEHGPRHRAQRAIRRLVEFAPSTGGLALWVRHEDVGAHDEVDDDVDGAGRHAPITTDGATVRYGRAFERLDLDLQTGLVAHQVLHIGLRHAQRFLELQRRTGDVDLRLFNVCADAIVNSALVHLGWLRLPSGSVFLEALLERALGTRVDADRALLDWDVERLYRAIDDRAAGRAPADRTTQSRRTADRPDQRAGDQRAGDRRADGRRADDQRADGPRAAAARALGSAIVADLRPAEEASSRSEDEVEQVRSWNERLVRAHANDGAFSLLRGLPADLPRTATPWEQVLRTRLARGLSTRPTLSWSRPTRSYIANQGRAGRHRRLPWEPGTSGTRRVPRLAVIVDVSGSIDDALMQRFATEVESITRRLEAGLVVVIGDDRVRTVTRFEPGRSGLRDVTFEGGGATDFTPLLEEADRHRPDLGVVLTDLDGPARFRPAWPVTWAVPDAFRFAVAPFGRVLVLQ